MKVKGNYLPSATDCQWLFEEQLHFSISHFLSNLVLEDGNLDQPKRTYSQYLVNQIK